MFEMDGTMLFVRKMKPVTAFYTDVLGFERVSTPQFGEDRFVVLRSGSSLLKLHSSSTPNGGRQKLQVAVTDLAAAREYLLGRKIRCGSIHNGYFDVKDPERNIVQFHTGAM